MNFTNVGFRRNAKEMEVRKDFARLRSLVDDTIGTEITKPYCLVLRPSVGALGSIDSKWTVQAEASTDTLGCFKQGTTDNTFRSL